MPDTENSKTEQALWPEAAAKAETAALFPAIQGASMASAINISPLSTFMFTLHNALQELPGSHGPITAPASLMESPK